MSAQNCENDARLTWATAVVMMEPPDPPATNLTFLCSSKIITGTPLDKGLLPGFIKFTGDGGSPNSFGIPGALKSSISLL